MVINALNLTSNLIN